MAYQTEFPPRVSPLVTDDIVFAGYIPFTEKAKSKSSTTTAISSNPTRTIKSGATSFLLLHSYNIEHRRS
jgi:hypothetical protein